MNTNEIVKINKDAFIQAGTIALTGVISSVLPFMAVPPLSFVLSKIARIIVTAMADKTELGIFFLYTDMRVDKEGRVYVDSAHAADKELDPLKAEELRKIADEAFKNFFKLTR
jgi:hypothetical protein